MELHLIWRRLEGDDPHRSGRELLAQIYEKQVGGEMPPIVIAPRGKPDFGEGDWHFSISHSKDHVFCALCSCPVGVDAEELTRQVKPGLAQKILSAGERRQYDAATDKNRALLTFWVLKEAAGKLTGQGIGFRPDHTDFSLSDPRVRLIDGALVAVCTQEDMYAV